MRKISLIMLLSSTILACSGLTDVKAPDAVQPSALNNAAGADALRSGVLTQFTSSYVNLLATVSQITDELHSTLFSGNAQDRRELPVGGSTGYSTVSLHLVRVNGLRAIAAYQAYAPTQRARIGQMYAINGYAELFLAEHVCSGVPLSQFLESRPEFGTQLTTAQLLTRAAADFDSAITFAGADARIANLGRVGRGRALLGLARYADAAAVVAAVPTNFVYQTENSAAVQPNSFATTFASARQSTVADREGGVGLNFRTAADPRVPTALIGKGADATTDVYSFTKYSSAASPITVASGIEARLIEAEAFLQAGDATAALERLNTLRTTVPGLAPLPLEPTAAARVDQLFRERAFWLFLTGTRLGDMRRLMRQYGRAQATVFPTGAYRGGQLYGGDINFPIELNENNNPNFKGCFDRNA